MLSRPNWNVLLFLLLFLPSSWTQQQQRLIVTYAIRSSTQTQVSSGPKSNEARFFSSPSEWHPLRGSRWTHCAFSPNLFHSPIICLYVWTRVKLRGIWNPIKEGLKSKQRRIWNPIKEGFWNQCREDFWNPYFTTKVHQPKVHQPKVHQPKVHQPKVQQPKVHQPKVHQPKQRRVLKSKQRRMLKSKQKRMKSMLRRPMKSKEGC